VYESPRVDDVLKRRNSVAARAVKEDMNTRLFRRVFAAVLAAGMAALLLVLGPGSSCPATAKHAPRLTVKALKSAWVPSLCGQHSGHLVHGKLPGIPSGQGEVRLRADKIAFGRFTTHGPRAAVVAVSCDRGGVAWPDYVVFYRPGAHGPVYDGKIWLAGSTPSRTARYAPCASPATAPPSPGEAARRMSALPAAPSTPAPGSARLPGRR